jgi:glutamine amidotransferase
VGWSAAAGGSITPRRKTAPAGANAAGRAEAAGESIAPAGRAEAAGESITEPAPSVPADLANAAAAVLRLADALPAADLLGLQARCDTALLWGMVLPRLRAGTQPADALAGTVRDIWAAGGTGRFNLLLTDGQMIAATAAGDSLCYRYRPDGVIVASEPSDDDPDWLTVPDDSVLEATTAGVTVRPITRPSGPAGPRNQPASYPNGKVTHP